MAPEPELEAVLFLNGINPLSQLALPQTSAADLGNTVPINSLTAACERVHTREIFLCTATLEHQLGEHTYTPRLG